MKRESGFALLSLMSATLFLAHFASSLWQQTSLWYIIAHEQRMIANRGAHIGAVTRYYQRELARVRHQLRDGEEIYSQTADNAHICIKKKGGNLFIFSLRAHYKKRPYHCRWSMQSTKKGACITRAYREL